MTDPTSLAALARLALTDDERQAFSSQLLSILEYVAKIRELDTSGVSEQAYGTDGKNVWRADEARQCDEAVRSAMITQFPCRADDLLEVPAVFESRTE